MARTLRLTRTARRDLDRIKCWLRQPGAGRAAEGKLARIRKAIRDLRSAPCSHPPGVTGTRVVTVAQHRVTYDVTPDTADNATAGDIRVLRIYGPGQSGE